MTTVSLPFIPPAPAVHATDLSVWRLLWEYRAPLCRFGRTTLSINYTSETAYWALKPLPLAILKACDMC